MKRAACSNSDPAVEQPPGAEPLRAAVAASERRPSAIEPLAYSLQDAGQALGGISVKTLHRWEREGKLTMTRLGRRTIVRRAELERVLAEAVAT